VAEHLSCGEGTSRWMKVKKLPDRCVHNRRLGLERGQPTSRFARGSAMGTPPLRRQRPSEKESSFKVLGLPSGPIAAEVSGSNEDAPLWAEAPRECSTQV
jgi:hypothetical protein